MPKGGSVGLYADVFNATNLGRASACNPTSGPNFGEAQGWTDPRTGRLGLRYSF